MARCSRTRAGEAQVKRPNDEGRLTAPSGTSTSSSFLKFSSQSSHSQAIDALVRLTGMELQDACTDIERLHLVAQYLDLDAVFIGDCPLTVELFNWQGELVATVGLEDGVWDWRPAS